VRPRERTLYQFRISHYCEKARWLLDKKGLPYRVREVPPGLHGVIVRARGGKGTVPLLRDGDLAVGDSTAIASHLEKAYPSPPLLPEDLDERARAWELEQWFSDVPGPAVRKWMYGQLFAHRRGSAAERLLAPLPGARALGRVVGPLLEAAIRSRYRIEPERMSAARSTMESAFERIADLTREDPDRYLVGDRLSVADIAAASMLAPLVAPEGSPWVSPERVPAIEELRDALRSTAGYRWVERRYERDRGRAAA
jgi:glutathione S-transferase